MLRKAVSKYRTDGLVSLFRNGLPFIIRSIRKVLIRNILEPILFKLWDQGYLSLDAIYPEAYYQRMTREEAMADAKQFADVVIDEFDPDSVIDLGCGVGRFLKPFADHGIEITGVEGSEKAIKNAIVPSDRLTQFDLRQPLTAHDKADIVLCIEVVEHLAERSSDTIAQSIADAGETAIITTARPGQGGKHHENEQPPQYWIKKLSAAGMVYDKSTTIEFRQRISPETLGWLSENILVFQSE
jgi:SAM-dependent methyltransferase